jgi:hypothetical protein
VGNEVAEMRVLTSLSTAQLTGDYNDDGLVNAADYIVWRNHFGDTFSLINEDPTASPGIVTVEDYDVWAANFQNPPPLDTALGSPVPEPATATLLFVIVLAGAWSGSRQKLNCRWHGATRPGGRR